MTTEQQRKMLECAAKACGPEYQYDELEHCWYKETDDDYFGNPEWNPLTNPADTAEMSITLMLWVSHDPGCVSVCNGNYAVTAKLKDHDNSRKKAWMHAATMCAAKTQGYES